MTVLLLFVLLHVAVFLVVIVACVDFKWISVLILKEKKDHHRKK